ncbi:MAG: sigma-70 family RNA polymerase sigma factor [Candidatus Cybelea sp.]
MKVEREVVEAARSGGDALDALIAELWPEAYRLAFGILRDRGLAEDAAQEACATIARRLSSLRDADAFTAWSYKIMTSRALDTARRRPLAQSLDELGRAGVCVEYGDSLDLYDALGSLEPRQRAAILLHYYAGLSSSEIAAALGVAPATVRFHLMRARAALRKALAVTDVARSLDEVLPDVH